MFRGSLGECPWEVWWECPGESRENVRGKSWEMPGNPVGMSGGSLGECLYTLFQSL